MAYGYLTTSTGREKDCLQVISCHGKLLIPFSGPTPLPIFGNLTEFSKFGLEQCLHRYKDIYGDIHTVWFGETPIVMICDVPTITETFIKDAETYSWRSLQQAVSQLRTQGKYGLLFNDGYMWKHHRRATLQVFKDFGMGVLSIVRV